MPRGYWCRQNLCLSLCPFCVSRPTSNKNPRLYICNMLGKRQRFWVSE